MNLTELSSIFCQNYLFCLRKASQDLKITLSQALCLITIPFDGISQSKLAKKLNLDISTLSRNLNNLIKIGIIKKENSDFDKRSYKISLTKSGHQKYKDLTEMVQNNLNTLFNSLDIHEKDQMVELLNKLNWKFELLNK